MLDTESQWKYTYFNKCKTKKELKRANPAQFLHSQSWIGDVVVVNRREENESISNISTSSVKGCEVGRRWWFFQSRWSNSLDVALHSGLLRLLAVKLLSLSCDGFLPVWLLNVLKNVSTRKKLLFLKCEDWHQSRMFTPDVLWRWAGNVSVWGHVFCIWWHTHQHALKLGWQSECINKSWFLWQNSSVSGRIFPQI